MKLIRYLLEDLAVLSKIDEEGVFAIVKPVKKTKRRKFVVVI